MQRLKTALEQLDETISALEDRIGIDSTLRRDQFKKQQKLLQASQSREAGVLAVAQKVASRLDTAIQHVESVLRD